VAATANLILRHIKARHDNDAARFAARKTTQMHVNPSIIHEMHANQQEMLMNPSIIHEMQTNQQQMLMNPSFYSRNNDFASKPLKFIQKLLKSKLNPSKQSEFAS